MACDGSETDEVSLLTHHPDEIIPLLADPDFATEFVDQQWEVVTTPTAQVEELQDQITRLTAET
jgi:gamma-glutamylcysteine synthetase